MGQGGEFYRRRTPVAAWSRVRWRGSRVAGVPGVGDSWRWGLPRRAMRAAKVWARVPTGGGDGSIWRSRSGWSGRRV